MRSKKQIVHFKTITHQKLGELSTLRSMERGEELYYRDDVINPTITENGVESIVYGSMKYKCSIEWDASTKEWDLSCSCPYDHGGICKHIIALGFWMIDNCKYSPADKTEGTTSEIDKLLKQADMSLLYNFVKNAISTDEVLLAKFKASINDLETSNDGVSIDELVKDYLELFTTLEISDEEEAIHSIYWQSHDYYVETWELIMEVQRREVEEQLAGAIDEITGLLKTGKLLLAVYNYFAFIEASVNYLKADMDYEYEISEMIISFLNDQEIIFNKLLKKQSFQPETIDLIINTFSQRYLTDKAESYLNTFEQILLTLPYTKDQAAKLLQSIRPISLTAADQLQMKLVQITKDKNIKLDICQHIFLKNIKAAKFLLNKYKKTPPEYHKFVEKIMPVFSRELLPEIFPNLKKEINPVLYRTAADKLYQMTGEIKYYLLFKDASPNFKFNHYIKHLTHISRDDKPFYIMLEESKFELAFKYYIKILRDEFDHTQYLEKLIDNLPQICYDYITKEATKKLSATNTRYVYSDTGRLLAVLLKFKDNDLKSKGNKFITDICQKYKNIPAMLDEFRNLKLI